VNEILRRDHAAAAIPRQIVFPDNSEMVGIAVGEPLDEKRVDVLKMAVLAPMPMAKRRSRWR
jgi:hypothetical protein